MSLPQISPQEAARRISEGALLVDIREADEYAREHIPGARHISLSRLSAAPIDKTSAEVVIFHCRSGARTSSNAATLRKAVDCEAFIVEGGLEAWRKAGLPVTRDASQPIEIMRQVQITAGSLVLIGAALGTFWSPAWYGLSAFVGAGLVFAGVSGTCAMARILSYAPWNRRAAATLSQAR